MNDFKEQIKTLYINLINKKGLDCYDCNNESQYKSSKTILENLIREYKLKLSSLSMDKAYVYDLNIDNMVDAIYFRSMIDLYEKKLFDLEVDYRMLID